MLGSIKILIGFGVGLIPVSAVATVGYLGGFSTTSSSAYDKYFQNNCHVLNDISSQTQKLLTCTGLADTYYLYSTKDGKNFSFLEVKSIKVQNNNDVLITLKTENPLEKTETLKAQGQNLKDFPQNIELVNNGDKFYCFFSGSGSFSQDEKMSWACTAKQPYEAKILSTLTVLKNQ